MFHSEPLYLLKGTSIDCSTANLHDSQHICTERVPRQAYSGLTLFLIDIKPTRGGKAETPRLSAGAWWGWTVMGICQSLRVTDEKCRIVESDERFSGLCFARETFYVFLLTGFLCEMSHFQRLCSLQFPGNFLSPGQPQFLLSVKRSHLVRMQRYFKAVQGVQDPGFVTPTK